MAFLRVCVLACLAVACIGAQGKKQSGDAAFGFGSSSSGFGLELDSESLREVQRTVEQKIKRKFTAPSGEQVWVVDDFVDGEAIQSAQGFYMLSTWWSFQLASRDGKDQEAAGDGIPWGARLNAEDTMRLVLGQQLQVLATVYSTGLGEVSGDTEIPNYLPCEVSYKIVRRGDLTSIHYGTPEEVESGDVWLMMFWNHMWKKDHYGDVLIYDKDKEIIGGTSPRINRAMLFRPSLGYLCRPPSVDFSQGENILMIKWSTNATKCSASEQQRRRDYAAIQAGIKDGFPLRGAADLDSGSSVDVAAKEVLRRRAQTGKQVVAFDDLFTEEDLLTLRGYVVSHGKMFYDDSIDQTSDNVQWISGFEVNYFVQSKYWKIVQKVVNYVSEGVGEWYPYDVSCNIIRGFDHTKIHGDVHNAKDDEWTFLLYLSPMDENDYGETAYFTKNSDKTEIVYQIRTRYGRSVIFEGLIPHAARPPAPTFKGPRYSFAVKMAKTPSRAIRNIMMEKVSQSTGLRSEALPRAREIVSDELAYSLYQKLDGNPDKFNKTMFQYMKKVDGWRDTVLKMRLKQQSL